MTDAPNEAGLPQIAVLAQFVKDLSFENPGVGQPQSQSKPAIQVGIDVQVRPLGPEQFEVGLRAMIEAKAGDAPIYVVELLYAGVFGLKNLPAEQQNPFLLIEAPRMLFPFARRVIADAVRDAGYPPLMLDPIDFNGLYIQQLQQRFEDEQAAGDSPAGQA